MLVNLWLGTFRLAIQDGHKRVKRIDSAGTLSRTLELCGIFLRLNGENINQTISKIFKKL